VIFTDIRMPEISGIELIKKARENNIKSEFIIVSGYAEFEYAKEVIKYSGYYYLLKPIDLDEAEELLKKLYIHLKQKQDVSLSDVGNYSEIHGESYITNENFKKLLDYINSNYSEEISLNELSEKFHLNTTYICDLFKEITDKTFLEYITDIRMKKACELLKDTRLSIAEIAMDLLLQYLDKEFNILERDVGQAMIRLQLLKRLKVYMKLLFSIAENLT
jgi:two-component system response regulator YesN